MSDRGAGRPLLSVRDLVVEYRGRRGHTFRAVDGVSFDVAQGETLGLVGESGSGKTTIGGAIQGILAPTSGEITLDGAPIRATSVRQRRALAERVQTVFQDPFGSLNPARRIEAAVEEPLLAHSHHLTRREVATRVAEELERVGLPPESGRRYPHEFSGGQRQRIAIARALISRPHLVICDEAVSALDLSIQAQILNLLADLRAERGVSYLFISHDLAVVQHIADRIAVLRNGHLVDFFDAADADPATWSTYTRKLFDSAPVPDPALQRDKRARLERLIADEREAAGREAAGRRAARREAVAG